MPPLREVPSLRASHPRPRRGRALSASKGQEEEIDEEEEANRALEEKRMKGNLPTPNLTAFQVVKWTLRYMFRFEFVMTMRMLLEVLINRRVLNSARP